MKQRLANLVQSLLAFNPFAGQPLPLSKVLVGILLAAALWFIMFAPPTKSLFPFWGAMTVSAIILTSFTTFSFPSWLLDIKSALSTPKGVLLELTIGIGMALAFWGVFWIGDKLSQLLFSFARPQVDLIYTMKDGYNATVVGFLLLLIIGPAEEIFWRSFAQRHLSRRFGPNAGFIIATLVYAAVHIPSLNFMLIMAALVIGALWGLFYRFFPSHLPALIISHAVWDTLAFVVIPF